MLLILLGAHDDLLPDLTTEEQADISELRRLWRNIQTQNRKQERMTRHCSHFKKHHHRSQQVPIMLTTEWEPQDANNRIYGPGTGDGNVGILASDYEKMEKSSRDLAAQVRNFSNWADERKAKDLREQIERMQQESSELKGNAFKDLCWAIGEAIAAGYLVLEVPPVAIYSGARSVDCFKESARQYVEAINIDKDAQKLLDLERSLERARSFGGRE